MKKTKTIRSLYGPVCLFAPFYYFFSSSMREKPSRNGQTIETKRMRPFFGVPLRLALNVTTLAEHGTTGSPVRSQNERDRQRRAFHEHLGTQRLPKARAGWQRSSPARRLAPGRPNGAPRIDPGLHGRAVGQAGRGSSVGNPRAGAVNSWSSTWVSSPSYAAGSLRGPRC